MENNANIARDIRALDTEAVCSLGQWLNRYMRLELREPKLTDSDQLLHVLVRSTREFESDFGVFRSEF